MPPQLVNAEAQNRSLRILERDLDRSLVTLKRVVALADDALLALAEHDPGRALEYRERVWTVALSLDPELESRR